MIDPVTSFCFIDKPPSVDMVRESYPYWVTRESGVKVPVVQAGAFTKYLGKLSVIFNDDGAVISAVGNSQLLDSSVPEGTLIYRLF